MYVAALIVLVSSDDLLICILGQYDRVPYMSYCMLYFIISLSVSIDVQYVSIIYIMRQDFDDVGKK